MKTLLLFLVIFSFESWAGYVAESKINSCSRADYSSVSICNEVENENCYKVPNDSGECGIFKLKDLYGSSKFDEESCSGQIECQSLLMTKVCGVGRWPLIDAEYSEVYCVEVVGKEMVIDQSLKAQRDALKSAQSQIEALVSNGKKAREACQKVLDLIGGFNLLPGRTTEQAGQMVSTFATAKQALQDGRPSAAHSAISAIPVDGVLVTQQMKDLALSFLSEWSQVQP